MIAYGAGSAGVVWQVKPILNQVLPREEALGRTIALILGFYFLKGLGTYVSDLNSSTAKPISAIDSRARSPSVSETARCTCATSLVMRDIRRPTAWPEKKAAD